MGLDLFTIGGLDIFASLITNPITITGDATLSNLYIVNGGTFNAASADNSSLIGRARDNGVGLTEILRFQSGADPYVQIGRDDTGVALNAITDALVLQMGGGTGNSAAGQGVGVSFKIGNDASELEERASIDAYLVFAGNGTEFSSFRFNQMNSGSMVEVFATDYMNLTFNWGIAKFIFSNDSAAAADTVTLGGYEISAGHRTLAIGSEEVVVAETDETKFSHKYPVRINGATYYAMLTAT